MVLKSKAKHAAVSAKLRKPFKFVDKMLIVQYEIAFQVGSLPGSVLDPDSSVFARSGSAQICGSACFCPARICTNMPRLESA